MLIGYEANNVLRNSKELGEYGRELISRLATKHIADYRALLFSTRIKSQFKSHFTSFANVSTYLPTGASSLLPSAWMRFSLNEWLKTEKVKLFHGLNDELPYGISRDIKTVITCYDTTKHHCTSLIDNIAWKRRMKYAYRASDAIVAVSNDVKKQLIDIGVIADKIVVIGGANPMEVTDAMVEQYFELYKVLLGER